MALYADPVILPIVVLLNLLGVSMIESVHAANEIYGLRSSRGADRQMLWAVIGVVLCVALLVLLRDHRWLRRYTWISAVAGGVLLLLPLLVPSRWLSPQRLEDLDLRGGLQLPARGGSRRSPSRSSSPAISSPGATP